MAINSSGGFEQLTHFDPELYTVELLVFPAQYEVRKPAEEVSQETATQKPAADQPEQLVFDQAAEPSSEPKKRNRAFGGFLKPMSYDPNGEYDLSSLTEDQKKWMTPYRLEQELFYAKRKPEALILGNVSVNPYEYSKFIRSPQAFARQAYASVLGENDLDEDRLAAARRAVHHQLEPRLVPMLEHLGKLRVAHEDVVGLLREERTPGFAHKSVDWMNEHIATTWREFDNILHVIRQQRGWNDETAERAKAAFINYLVTGEQRTRVGHWIKMTRVAAKYLDARVRVFTANSEQVQEILAEYPLPNKQNEAA